ncbi:hypothetical protein D9M70_590920 [compost metagenome]
MDFQRTGHVVGRYLCALVFVEGSHNRLTSPSSVFTGIEALGLQRVGDVTSDADGNLAASVCVTLAVTHGSQRRRQFSCVRTVVLAAEGEHGVFLAVVATQRVGLVVEYIRVLGAVHHQQTRFSILTGC